MREVDIMKCIKHPSIIEITDFFETNDTINIVMEHFSLSSLTEFTKNHRPLSDITTRSIIEQIAEALAYLHKMKIAHRDIKPENILINEGHQIKIIDLGLSLMGDHS
jgi:serine/threonine protein kinase